MLPYRHTPISAQSEIAIFEVPDAQIPASKTVARRTSRDVKLTPNFT